MDNPLSPIVADVYMSTLELVLFNNNPPPPEVHTWLRYLLVEQIIYSTALKMLTISFAFGPVLTCFMSLFSPTPQLVFCETFPP